MCVCVCIHICVCVCVCYTHEYTHRHTYILTLTGSLRKQQAGVIFTHRRQSSCVTSTDIAHSRLLVFLLMKKE